MTVPVPKLTGTLFPFFTQGLCLLLKLRMIFRHRAVVCKLMRMNKIQFAAQLFVVAPLQLGGQAKER